MRAHTCVQSLIKCCSGCEDSKSITSINHRPAGANWERQVAAICSSHKPALIRSSFGEWDFSDTASFYLDWESIPELINHISENLALFLKKNLISFHVMWPSGNKRYLLTNWSMFVSQQYDSQMQPLLDHWLIKFNKLNVKHKYIFNVLIASFSLY